MFRSKRSHDDYPNWAESHFNSFLTSEEELTEVIPLMNFFFSKSALGFTDRRMIYTNSSPLSTNAYDIEAPKIKSISLETNINIVAFFFIIGAISCIIYSLYIIFINPYPFTGIPLYQICGIIFILISALLFYIGLTNIKISGIKLDTYFEKDYWSYGMNPRYNHFFKGNSSKCEEAIRYIREWEYTREKIAQEEKKEVEVEAIEEVEESNNVMVCSQCGNDGIYINEFEKWYCEHCKKGLIIDEQNSKSQSI